MLCNTIVLFCYSQLEPSASFLGLQGAVVQNEHKNRTWPVCNVLPLFDLFNLIKYEMVSGLKFNLFIQFIVQILWKCIFLGY